MRFGIAGSALFATVTTDASCGAVNSMHDSFTPLGGLVPLFNMQTDEVIFGGVGAGLYGMLLYRHPRGLHRRAHGRAHAGVPRQEDRAEGSQDGHAGHSGDLRSSILVFTAISSVIRFAKDGYWNPPGPATANLNNAGPHGLSEILYAYIERHREQRQRVRRHHRQHALVQPDASAWRC